MQDGSVSASETNQGAKRLRIPQHVVSTQQAVVDQLQSSKLITS